MPNELKITIDGVVAAGKDTTAYALAQRLDLTYVDTGALYRAAAWKAAKLKANINDEEVLHQIIKQSDFHVEAPTVDDGRKFSVIVDGQDVTTELRTDQMDMWSSIVAKTVSCRVLMIESQKQIAQRHPRLVMTGRGIGRTVIPDADLKIYLTAVPEVRARRRLQDKLRIDPGATYERILDELLERDVLNRERDYDPDKPTDDAVIIDTSDKSVEQVVNEIISHL